MITLNTLDNGNLEIVLDDREELMDVEARQYQDERDDLFDIFERTGLIGNGYSILFNVGLTEVPAIGYMAEFDDENNFTDCETLWIYPNYMIDSYFEELKENGKVIFKKWVD